MIFSVYFISGTNSITSIKNLRSLFGWNLAKLPVDRWLVCIVELEQNFIKVIVRIIYKIHVIKALNKQKKMFPTFFSSLVLNHSFMCRMSYNLTHRGALAQKLFWAHLKMASTATSFLWHSVPVRLHVC